VNSSMSDQQNSVDDDAYDQAAGDVVSLGNTMADQDPEADVWAIADGLLAGAVHYWLYSRIPCGDPACEDCAPISTAELRVEELIRTVRGLAESSEYYHTPNDSNVGRA
jgi:hypothetical protein